MNKENLRAIQFRFPKEQHKTLKTVCAELGVSYKEYISSILIRSLKEYMEKRKR